MYKSLLCDGSSDNLITIPADNTDIHHRIHGFSLPFPNLLKSRRHYANLLLMRSVLRRFPFHPLSKEVFITLSINSYIMTRLTKRAFVAS